MTPLTKIIMLHMLRVHTPQDIHFSMVGLLPRIPPISTLVSMCHPLTVIISIPWMGMDLSTSIIPMLIVLHLSEVCGTEKSITVTRNFYLMQQTWLLRSKSLTWEILLSIMTQLVVQILL